MGFTPDDRPGPTLPELLDDCRCSQRPPAPRPQVKPWASLAEQREQREAEALRRAVEESEEAIY